MSGKEDKYMRKGFRKIERLTGFEFREWDQHTRTDIDVHLADDLGSGLDGLVRM